MSKILIVDDDKNLRYSIKNLMSIEGYEIDESHDGPTALKMIELDDYDVVLMDIRMPGMSGLEAFDSIHMKNPKLPVIIMTAFGSTETAIEAMRLGAYDYVLKPFDVAKLKHIVSSAVEDSRLTHEVVSLPDQNLKEPGGVRLIGSSPVMQEIYKLVGKVSRTETSVLIFGPSGSGKEMVARAIFHYSSRHNKPFQAINCAAIPSELLESELFGHEKGAFTGANETKLGRFERCNNGTLFLDEIGDMSQTMQAKILRVLQEQSFARVGGSKTIHVDVRVIAATNRDLKKMVKTGEFREDLYFRLGVVKIYLPPLSERRSDIPELISYFMNRFQRESKQQKKGITNEAINYLTEQPWPGNVRELQSAVQRAIVLRTGQVLRKEDFAFIHDDVDKLQTSSMDEMTEFTDSLFRKAENDPTVKLIPTMERLLVERALKKTNGNQVKAANLLGISRNTLRNRIDKFNMAKKGSENK